MIWQEIMTRSPVPGQAGWCWQMGWGHTLLGEWMARLQEWGLSGFVWPQGSSSPSRALQLPPSSARHCESKSRASRRNSFWYSSGFSSLSSATINHLVLGTIQICNLNSSDSLPWPMPEWAICKCVTLETHSKWDAVVVNGIGQLGSFEFHILEKLTLPQFPYLQNEVIIASVLFGENSLKTHVRHLAWSLAYRKCVGHNSSGMLHLVLDRLNQRRHRHPGGATEGWRIECSRDLMI